MSIIIQSITVSWNKEYRGGKAAVKRNALPNAFELPLKACINPESNSVIIHEVKCTSYNNFQILENVYSNDDSEIKIKGTLLKIDNELLHVYFNYSDYDCGKPYRGMYDETGLSKSLREKAFDLQNNEYGRIVFNGRYTDLETRDWHYEKKVHNIIRTDKIKKDIFLEDGIIKKYEQLAVLR